LTYSARTPAVAWPIPKLMDYLAEWGITVVRVAGEFKLRPPPGMPKEQFEFVAEVARGHIVPQRAAFLAQFQAGESIPLYRSLPADEKRRFDYRRVITRAELIRDTLGWSSRPVWASTYNHTTGYLTAEHKAFPEHATHANLIVDVPPWAAFSPGGVDPGEMMPYTWAYVDRFGKTVVAGRDGPGGRWLAFDVRKWLPLPGSRPPAKWREYPGFTPPPEWHAPPGWYDREAKRRASEALAARRQWYRQNWGTAGNLPD
jgi:hypothetical protein